MGCRPFTANVASMHSICKKTIRNLGKPVLVFRVMISIYLYDIGNKFLVCHILAIKFLISDDSKNIFKTETLHAGQTACIAR